MAKRVNLTETIKQYITAKCGADVDYTKFAIYQTRAISTEPVTKRGSIYDKATFTRTALSEIVDFVNDDRNNVAMQLLHDTYSMPFGRVIHAELVDEVDTGHSAVMMLFILSDEHSDLINKIDQGIIDEVSINTLPKRALCSECGKDFMDDDVPFEAFFEHKCPECGAIMGGKEGAHLSIPSIETMIELSLVPRGAAKHAKILDSAYQMAMSDKADSLVLTKQMVKESLTEFNFTSNISEEVDMNPEDFKAAVMAATEPLATEVKNMQATLASLGEEKKTLEAAKLEAETAKAALEEEKETLSNEKAELESKLAEATKEAEEIKAAFDAEIKKVLVASGTPEASIPSDLKGKQELLSQSRLTLAAIPVDGKARGADTKSAELASVDASLDAFKVK